MCQTFDFWEQLFVCQDSEMNKLLEFSSRSKQNVTRNIQLYNIRVPLQIWRDQTALVKIKFFKWIQNQLFCNLKEEIKVQFIMCELKTYLYMATSLVNNRHSRQKRKKIAPKMFGKFQRTSTFSPLAHLKSNVDF